MKPFVLESISKYAVHGIDAPEPTMFCFGGNKRKTAILLFAEELSTKDGYKIVDKLEIAPSTEIELPYKCGEATACSITGMQLVGWALSPDRASRGFFEFAKGEKFITSYPGQFVFFPVYEPYVVERSESESSGDFVTHEVHISTEDEPKTVSYSLDSLCVPPPGTHPAVSDDDLDKCDITPYRNCTVVVQFNTSGGSGTAASIVVDVDGVKISSANGATQAINLVESVGYSKDIKLSHKVSFNYGDGSATVTFVDWISEWHLHPKMVYSVEEG